MLTSIRVQCRWHTSRANMRKILRLISLILIEVSCSSCGWSYLLYMKVISTGLNSRMYSYWSITEPVQSVRPSEWIASGTMKATNCKQRIKHLKTTFLAACKFIFESRFISKQAPCLYLGTQFSMPWNGTPVPHHKHTKTRNQAQTEFISDSLKHAQLEIQDFFRQFSC